MKNDFNKQNPSSKPQATTEVVVVKVLIIFALAIIPVAFMLMDISKKIIDYKASQSKSGQVQTIGSEYDFKVQIPANVTGDVSRVSQEKIDSLFNNLK